jgi:hypothetical protein
MILSAGSITRRLTLGAEGSNGVQPVAHGEAITRKFHQTIFKIALFLMFFVVSKVSYPIFLTKK